MLRATSPLPRRAFSLLVPALLLLAPVSASGQDFAAEHARAAKELVPKLAELAKWCARNRLNRERDRLYRAIIAFDADHKVARRGLKYKKLKRGGWRAPKRYREPKNYAPKNLPELAKRRAAIAGPFIDAQLDLVEKHRAALSTAQRYEVMAKLAALDPENGLLRRELGERKVGDEWLLIETAGARERRSEIGKKIAEARKTTEARCEKTTPDEGDDAVGLPWTGAWKTPFVKVVGTVPDDELRATALEASMLRAAWPAVLGEDVDILSGTTIYVLRSASEARRLIEKHPRVSDRNTSKLNETATRWLRGRLLALAVFNDKPEIRFRGVLNSLTGDGLQRHLKLGARRGFFFDGLMMYMTDRAAGFRHPWDHGKKLFASERAERDRLMKPGFDLLAHAARLSAARRLPKIQHIAERKADEMKPADWVCAYAFAAMIFEGRPHDGRALITKMTRERKSPEEASRLALDSDLTGLDVRLGRWLAEMP